MVTNKDKISLNEGNNEDWLVITRPFAEIYLLQHVKGYWKQI